VPARCIRVGSRERRLSGSPLLIGRIEVPPLKGGEEKLKEPKVKEPKLKEPELAELYAEPRKIIN